MTLAESIAAVRRTDFTGTHADWVRYLQQHAGVLADHIERDEMSEPRRFRWRMNSGEEGDGLLLNSGTVVVVHAGNITKPYAGPSLSALKRSGYTITKWIDEPPPEPRAELEMLKVDYHHDSCESLVQGLEKFFAIYANRENWRSSQGEPPHHLRAGMLLDFHPSNVVHGWSFAEEAIEKIQKFRSEQSPPEPLSDVEKLEVLRLACEDAVSKITACEYGEINFNVDFAERLKEALEQTQ